MPLITCQDCGTEISDRAPACPKCGAPQGVGAPSPTPPPVDVSPKPSFGFRAGRFVGRHKLAFGLLAVVWIASASGFLNSLDPMPKASKQSPADEATTRAFVGAKALKSMMRDPESFQIEQALVMDDGTACYTYRAKNGFGGVNVESAVLLPGADSITTDKSPGFEAAWQQHCAGKKGSDVAASIRFFQ